MTSIFAWICAAIAAFGTLGAAYFFDKHADEGISAANEKAALAGERAANASERAANLENEAAAARERTARLELQLKIEQSQRAQDQRQIYPRYVNVVEMRELEKAFKNKFDDLRIFYVDDPETSGFASNILQIISSFGVTVFLKAAPADLDRKSVV